MAPRHVALLLLGALAAASSLLLAGPTAVDASPADTIVLPRTPAVDAAITIDAPSGSGSARRHLDYPPHRDDDLLLRSVAGTTPADDAPAPSYSSGDATAAAPGDDDDGAKASSIPPRVWTPLLALDAVASFFVGFFAGLYLRIWMPCIIKTAMVKARSIF